MEQADWATSDKAGTPAAPPPKKAPTSPTPSSVRSMTPVNPALEGLRNDLDSRPQTPTVVGLDKDEREEFLRRENELSDQLAERESVLVSAEKLVKELKEELAFLKEQEASLSKVCLTEFSLLIRNLINLINRRTSRCPEISTSFVCKWSVLTTTTRRV